MRRDEFMLYVDEKACVVKNKINRFRHCFAVEDRRLLQKNMELKASEGDEVCFVLGNGPSLLKTDLKELQRYTTFTVNYFHKGSLGLESTYHVMIDPVFYERDYEYTVNLIKQQQNTKFILPYEFYRINHGRMSSYEDRMFFVKRSLKSYGDFVACDMTKLMTDSLNIVPFTLQCALSMGYKKIYLLGFEFGLYGRVVQGYFYHPADKNEIPEPSIGIVNCLLQGGLVQRYCWALQRYALAHRVKIMNLSPETYINAFPIGSLDMELKSLHDDKRRLDDKAPFC